MDLHASQEALQSEVHRLVLSTMNRGHHLLLLTKSNVPVRHILNYVALVPQKLLEAVLPVGKGGLRQEPEKGGLSKPSMTIQTLHYYRMCDFRSHYCRGNLLVQIQE